MQIPRRILLTKARAIKMEQSQGTMSGLTGMETLAE